MRFIHTADWHLGNQMHEIDRREEAQNFLIWLKSQIIEKKANTLVISGDIFDTSNPPIEARRLYYSFLASLINTCCKNVIIVGGNHDSASMLDSAKELLEVLNIRVVGSINNLELNDMCFELFDENKNVCGICIALPFVRELELRNFLMNSENKEKILDSDLFSLAYKELYSKLYGEAEKLRSGREIPIIATGHLYASDLEGRLSEKKSNEKTDDGVKVLDVLGTLGNVPPSVFPKADYIALGHIHYSTMVTKNPAIRYSGSPFVMGFDEANIPHCVLCVDVEKKENFLKVEKIETPQIYVYKRISGEISEIRSELQKFSGIFEKDGKNSKKIFLELCYKREIGVNIQEILSDSIRALPENVSVVSWKIADSEKFFEKNAFENFDASEIRNLDDNEIFTQLILSKSGLKAEDENGKLAIEKFLPLFLKLAEEVE